jgi:membrane-associated protein
MEIVCRCVSVDAMTHLPTLPTLPTLPAGPIMYAVLAALIIASAVPVVAVVVPAEPFLMAAVLLSGDDGTSVGMLLLVTVVSSLAGDVLSYSLGRRYGARLLSARGVRRYRGQVTRATQTLRRRGVLASVVLQRWIPPGRGFAPVIIGATEQRFDRFVGSATVAATLWGAVIVLGVHYGGPHLVMAIPLVLTPLLLVHVAHRIARRVLRRRGTGAATPAARDTVIGRDVSAEAASQFLRNVN